MKQLSQQAFQQAASYIQTHGRRVDQARFAFHFAEGSAADVLTALAAYQNEDGGFGHGLEPDLRTTASSAVATQQACNLFRELGTTSDEPMVQQAVEYLLATFDHEELRWEIVPSAVEDAPHAPWWTYGESAGSDDGFRSNPRPALIGFLCDYKSLVPADLLTKLIGVQLGHLAVKSMAGSIDMHALPCYITLATSPHLPAEQREALLTLLVQGVAGTVATDPAGFAAYQLLPLDVAPTPDALLAATVERSAVDAHLDYLIETQLADGSWPLPWSWAFVDEAAWAQVEQDWKGHIAINRLRTFQAWERLSST
ncbi:MAG: hypothetical protein KDE19_06385 [Caldilineaceae bacterium]|nr:hypothetical protein [Caldilineaceae bacterium]